MSDQPHTSPKKRYLPVTLLGWLVAVGGLVLTPISFISLLMILVGSYGTKTSDPLGFFLVVLLPPLLVLAGIGLVRRWRWSWVFLVAGLMAVLAWQAAEWRRPPAGPPVTTVSPSGLKTTTFQSGPHVSTPLAVLCLGLLAFALSTRVRREFCWSRMPSRPSVPPPIPAETLSPTLLDTPATNDASRDENARGWRVGHRGRDAMYYEEMRDGHWQRIDIDGEMLTGRAHHVIYFRSLESWRQLPGWACDRREEIITRIKSEFREPDYEYYESAAAGTVPVGSPVPTVRVTTPSGQRLAALGALAFLLGLAGWMGWLVAQGFGRGEVPFPSSKSTLRRTVARESEPVMFWVSLGLYAGVGAGSLGLINWGWRQSGNGEK